jgi:hypothetical protein
MKTKKLILLLFVAFGLVYCGTENDVTGYIETGNVEEVKKLLAKDLNPMDTVGNRTYFQYAVYEGQLDIVKEFFNHSGQKLEDYQIKDLLFLSIKEQQSEIYHYLIDLVDFENEPHNVTHLFNLLEEAGWEEEVGKMIQLNTDVGIFYSFFEQNKENDDFKDVLLSLFLKQVPINECYIGSEFDSSLEYEEEGEYEEYDEPEMEYEYGSFSSMINKINEKRVRLMVKTLSADTEGKKALITLDGNPNKLFNSFYQRVFLDDDFEHYDGDFQDIRIRYTATIARRLPYFLPKYSRYNDYYRDDNELEELHNSNKQLFAYLFHRIDRNSLIIKWLWSAWKKTVFSNIPTKTYFRKSFYDYTEALIKTYDTITSRDNYNETLRLAYRNLATNKCQGYIEDCIPESIRYYEDGWRIDWGWAPSFWARRFHEGNQEEVYKILKEISAHYAGNELNKLIEERLDKEISEASYLSAYKQLAKEGANADLLIGKRGVTKLHVAVLKNNLKEIKKLIENGADVNARDDKKYTPLYFATQLETVKLLVEKGALVNDSIMRTKPAKYFRSNNKEEIADFLEKWNK